MISENVTQYLISCPPLVLGYVSLNILSEKTSTVRSVLVLMFEFEERIRVLSVVKLGKFKASKDI